MAAGLADQRRPGGSDLGPPPRIGHLGLRLDQNTFGGLAVGQAPEPSRRPGHGDDRPLVIGRGGGRQLGEQFLSLDVSAACEQHIGQHVGRLERVVCVPRRTRQAFGGHPIEGEVGVARGRQQKPGCRRAASVEAPQCQANRVVASGGTLALQGVGQRAHQPATAEVGKRRSHDVAVERMGGPGDDVLAVDADGDDAGGLETLHRVVVGQLVEHSQTDRLADGDDFERRALVLVKGTEAFGHQLGQASRSRREGIDAPQSFTPLDQTEADRFADELTEVQRVAGTAPPQPRGGERLHRPVEDRFEQVAHRLVTQGCHVEPLY
jgi:hypothetical protein